MIAASIPVVRLAGFADVIGIGRDDARDAARRELGKRIYHADDPSLVSRVIQWLTGWIAELVATASQHVPGGWPAIVALVVLLVLIVVVVRLGIGPVGRGGARRALLTETPLSADDHRAAADAHAERGDYAQAIAERLRAIAADLDARAIVDARPGLTADELAAQAAEALPTYAERLHAAAHLFDDVWYGDHPATADGDATLRTLDTDLRTARPNLTGSPA